MDRADIRKEIQDIIWSMVTIDWDHGESFIVGYSDAADGIMLFLEPLLKEEE